MNNWKNKKTNEEILEINRAERLNKTGISKYGFPMKIIEYRNAEDIDIDIDGTIVQHKNYRDFITGNICKTRNDMKFLRIGETSTNKIGLSMTIIDYRLYNDIDIKFEDGTIVKHKDYYAFKTGNIKNPNYIKEKIIVEKPIKKSQVISRVGEVNKANNGLLMTIIAYRTRKDIDIKFEDGVIVTNKRYQHFLTGEITHPNIKIGNNQPKVNRIGETITTYDGIKATIINYRNREDIDIQLDDGSILEHISYEKFNIGHINCKEYRKNKKLGQTRINYNGQKMTIIDYHNMTNISIQFEDGYIKNNVRYNLFDARQIRRPFPYMLKDIKVIKKAYNYNNVQNYYYLCTKCCCNDIGTIEEINNHICEV